MKLLLAVLITFNCFLIAANNDAPGWQSEYGKTRSFIENKGQFNNRLKTNSPILFAHDGGDHNYYFTKEGIIIELSHKEKRERTNEEKEFRKIRKSEGGLNSHEEWQQLQETDFQNRLVETRDELSATWIGANPNVEIIAEDKDGFYHSYTFYNSANQLININEIASYQKLIYKNIYPNIDVIYEFHEEIGIKYSVVLHPGANPSVIQLKYSKNIELLPNGKIKTLTNLGDIIDHEPLTFYAENSNNVINSKYHVQGNTVSFELSNYDNSKKVVIDPWTQTPNFNTNWKCVWECEKDGAGNVYLIGGVMPLQLLKYNSAGTLQWTYNTPYDTTMWLGTFATDDLGNSYVSNGSSARMQKINTAGAMVWNNPSPSGLGGILTEFWTITFNCDQTRLVIGGTGGSFIPVSPYIYEMDMNSGNVVNSAQIHVGAGLDGSEIRSITPTNNGRYYYLSHDSLGYIHNNLSACSSGSGSSSSFIVGNGTALSYKCENYRYDNSGIAALSYFNNFVFYNRGNQLQKRDFYTGAIISTVNIPGGSLNGGFGGSSVSNSGIDIDGCGNIYVGSTNGVYVFDQNLTQINSFATSFNVYDVEVSTSGDIIACGSTGTSGTSSRTGYIQSFSAGACSPTTIECCDVALCPVDDLCVYDAPFSITPIGTPGGTWSGTGVNASGVFDPAVAGVGSHSITYTLPCGFETITIVVNECPQLEICIDENGDLVASGGNGEYNWATGVVGPTSYPINNEQQCIDCPSTTPQYTFGFYTGCSSSTCNTTDTTWTPVATGNTYTPTTYPLLVADGNGTFIILGNANGLADCVPTVPCPTITVNIQNQTNVLCFGDFSGSATVNASGGNGSYNYTWTPGNLNGATQNNLSAQTYTVNVTDSDGCPGTVQVNITGPTALSATTSSTEACNGNDGSATINVSGGTGAYTYTWNPNVGNTATVTDLSIGDYEVTVTDQNGCSIVETISVTCGVVSCPTITVSITNQTDVLCFGGNNGSATVSASGGNGPYTFIWDDGLGSTITGATQNSVSGNTYTVYVTDSDNCPGSMQVTINQPTQLTATTSSVEASCGESDGSATVNPSGGTGSYTYTWNPNVGTTATVNNIPAGSYQVTVTDANNCQLQQNILVNNQNAPVVDIISVTNESCVGAADGEATIEATGGSGNYTYSWSPSGGTNATASNLTAGTYTVTVTDDAGCETAVVISIFNTSAIIIDAVVTDEDCGVMNGELFASASGGSGNYTYLWSNGETTSSINNLQTGNYTVTVTDDLGCSATETFNVGVIGSLDVTVNPVTTTIVAGESVQLEASGGFTYTWTPEAGLSCTNCPNPIASPINTTSYTVVAVDENGCAGEATVFVFVEALCGEFFIPTIFSPNSDGTNDKHCVLGGCVTEFELIIYNRWGERVFVSRDQANCWDGYFRGQQVQTGVYVYKIKATLVDGTKISDSGNINVVR